MKNTFKIIKSNDLKNTHNKVYRINHFKNCESPSVLGKITVDEVLHKIKYGDENLLNIKKARDYGKGHPQYDELKKTVLPTFRFNFLFKVYANNENAVNPTGLIYIDVDNTIEIPHSDYIYAMWRSLSNTGYGILVKVDNLTLDNFKDVYESLGIILGVKVDDGARKPIQQNVLSYDPSLYCNTDSRVYEYEHSKKASPSIIKKKKECIVLNEASVHQSRIKERVDNSFEYFIGNNSDKEFLYFENKIKICAPFMPWHGIEKGNRNNFLFRLLSQFALLNPTFGRNYLQNKSAYFNKKINPNLTKIEINSIVNSVIKKREEDTLEIYLNKERLILFNPNMELTKLEKCQIVGSVLGAKKNKETQQAMYEILEDWDFEEFGQITQKLVISISKFSRSRVQRHWFHFKDYVEDLNNENKRKSA
ncbi:primase C-terminal domain-containing protein [Flavobacterium sp.]|jgi:hypothetical protein|uniref:primase C-terminal domain-containing protein n=1 Tax=Flavobacterium sp. TaxID=239 RepID=UPI0037BE6A24